VEAPGQLPSLPPPLKSGPVLGSKDTRIKATWWNFTVKRSRLKAQKCSLSQTVTSQGTSIRDMLLVLPQSVSSFMKRLYEWHTDVEIAARRLSTTSQDSHVVAG